MNKTFSTVAVATAILTGYYVLNAQNKTELTGILLANIEALADGDDTHSQEYPKYINEVKKSPKTEFKTEIKTDSTGISISIEYSRKCTSFFTYCKHTGKEGDICYGNLNGVVTDCDAWSKE